MCCGTVPSALQWHSCCSVAAVSVVSCTVDCGQTIHFILLCDTGGGGWSIRCFILYSRYARVVIGWVLLCGYGVISVILLCCGSCVRDIRFVWLSGYGTRII